MKSLRIILVMTEPPLPFGHATARWSYVLLKGLVQRGHRVAAFAASSDRQAIGEVEALFPSPEYDLRCHVHPIRNRLQSKLQAVRRPYSYMFSSRLRSDLGAELARGFDLLHLEGTWAGWLSHGDDVSRSVLNVHNLYALDLPDQAPVSLTEKLRSALQRRAESRLLRTCSTLITATPRLERAVRAVAPATPVYIVPLALDLALYLFVPPRRRPREPVVSLIGSMDWYPSRSAAVRLLTRLWPEIKQRVASARLRIVGRHARRALGDFLGQSDVEIAENVMDIRPYFEASSVLLYAPARGSGMKVKILEAFAYGVPVVTTNDGVEGLPAEDSVHVGLCDDDRGLIERTVALLNDSNRQEQQRRAARQLLERHCNADAALDAVERCYADILARRNDLAA